MNLYHLRIQLGDKQDGDTTVAGQLRAVGVNILDRSPRRNDHGEPAEGPIDDVLIDLTANIDLPLIEYVLKPAGCRVLDLRPAGGCRPVGLSLPGWQESRPLLGVA